MSSWRRLLLAVAVAVAVACGPAPESDERELATARAVADDASAPVADRARANRRLAGVLIRRGHLREAATRLETAAQLFADEPVELPPTLNALSDVLLRLADFEAQQRVLWQALEIAAELGDRRSMASSWNNLGVGYAYQGRPSAALAAYHRCLELRRDLDEPRGLAATRHNVGVQLLLLGRVGEGIEELDRAVDARRRLGDPAEVGKTLASLAWGLGLDGRQDAALEAYAESIALLEEAEAIHELPTALEQRAQLLRTLGRLDGAREDLRRSLELLDAAGGAEPLEAAYLRLGLGAIEHERAAAGDGASADAVVQLRAAVETFDALGAQEGRILARLELARALRVQEGGRGEAVRLLEAAIEIVEAARSELRLPSFRATFLGGWQAVYQELVDVLASAAAGAPPAEAADLAERALEVAERARARALLDRMGSSPPADVESPRKLREQVEELEAQALLEPAAGVDSGTRGSQASADEARAELRRARFELERALEVSERVEEPTPAATPAGLDAIRRQLDAETVMLVYALAPRRSWLWRVDPGSVSLHSLSPGPEIEAAARKVHQLLPLHDKPGYGKASREALARLSRLVLGPVTADLDGDTPSRLAIVPDGALHLVPFGALPLAEKHEIVHLPSASTLVELRRRADREPAPRLLAIVADPVFEAGDPRLGGGGGQVAESPSVSRTRRAIGGRLGRLPASAEEGARIAEVARQAAGVAPEVHLGFDARRELITAGGLGDVRILHFATHGVVDAEDPALAGLVLSLFDAAGEPQDGLLRARDLYDLRLSADLVVLSACRTALGQEIRGEGLVGLADGFFAAGANHLIVSLWDVDDRATAELMVRLYRHLLIGDRGPADALRHAQRELREQTEWRSPAYWAGFVAVGDWR